MACCSAFDMCGECRREADRDMRRRENEEQRRENERPKKRGWVTECDWDGYKYQRWVD